MFTGIVQARAKVGAIKPQPGGIRLIIDRSDWSPPGGYQPAHGDSICISGVCLTVVEASAQLLHFDVIAETLAKTTLGELREGSAVNIEPSVTLNQPLGGHFMQGHVDGVGVITGVQSSEEESRLIIEPPADLMPYIVPKGSIAIDGISLTLAAVGRDNFEVALIPTTLAITTLGHVKEGDRVNLEADIISKTVVNFLQRQREDSAITPQLLKDAGFIV